MTQNSILGWSYLYSYSKSKCLESYYMNIAKQGLLMNSFFTSQSNYYPLIWMFHSRGLNNKIDRQHERCLRIAYSDNRSSFEHLLDKDKSVSIHVKNLQTLSLEMLKVEKNLSAPIVRFLKNEIMFTTFKTHLNSF